MATYTFRVVDVINNLKTRLKEYAYGDDGLSIIKELLQNADDAGASALDFLLFDSGIEDAVNPLLRGPALVAVNDGAFKERDETNIIAVAGTSKAEDAGAIGRFGPA